MIKRGETIKRLFTNSIIFLFAGAFIFRASVISNHSVVSNVLMNVSRLAQPGLRNETRRLVTQHTVREGNA